MEGHLLSNRNLLAELWLQSVNPVFPKLFHTAAQKRDITSSITC